MRTMIRFTETLRDVGLPVLAIELELPVGFAFPPVAERRTVIEAGLARAMETTQRILELRRIAA